MPCSSKQNAEPGIAYGGLVGAHGTESKRNSLGEESGVEGHAGKNSACESTM